MSNISIDPGVDGAYAVWTGDRLVEARLYSGGSKALLWEERVDIAMNVLRMRIEAVKPAAVWCEWPEYYESKSFASKNGDLVKLTAVCGRIWEIAKRQRTIFVPILYRQWAGQMDPAAIEYRIRKRLDDCDGFKSHVWDAVGIGLHQLGRF